MPIDSAFGYHSALMAFRPAFLATFAAVLCEPTSAPAQSADGAIPPTPDLLESRNATIREIRFNIGDVFDLSNPEESKRIHRFANRLHIRTKQSTLESVVLPRPGDEFDARVNDESARALRARGFIADASITPVDYDPASNTVALQVNSRDSWSLSPDLKFSRTGGVNEYAFGIEEENLLGLGKEVTLTRSSDIDRDETLLGYSDPNVRGTRTRLNTVLADASDGHRRELVVGRPFFSFDSRWAVETRFTDTNRIDSMYGLGEVIDQFRHDISAFSIWGGWSKGLRGNRTRRWLAGVTSDEHRFFEADIFGTPALLPSDRKLVYPFIGMQIAEDDFRQVTELNVMGRTEDVSLGLNTTMQLGYASQSYGSDRDAAILLAEAHKGWEPGGAGRLLLFDVAAQTRVESGDTRNSLISSSIRYYRRNLDDHLLTVSLRATLGSDLDAENQILLGGDSDLRGYPLRYQSGERSAVLTVEQRFFTDMYLFRLVRVGYAVFADAGRVWGTDARGAPNLGTLYDIGVGLRFVSPRASSNSVVHVDLAFPVNAPPGVDSVQLSIERKGTF